MEGSRRRGSIEDETVDGVTDKMNMNLKKPYSSGGQPGGCVKRGQKESYTT